MTDGPNSKWVSIANAEFVPSGQVLYDIMFDLTGFDSSAASITGGMVADGDVIDVLISGTSLAQGTSFDTFDHFTAFTVNSGFTSGLNVLTFLVNHEDGDYDAFRAELSGTASAASTPEPASMILMTGALVGLATLRRRRRTVR